MIVDGKPRTPVVAIVGAGMSGVCIAAKLRGAGIDTFTIFEKAAELGGTWRDNRYPGLTCDVPSPFYSYSFAPNPDWSQRFSGAEEIHGYFRSVAERFDLPDRIRCNAEIVEATFEEPGWKLVTAGGEEFRADVVVLATGVLHHPREPRLPGIESFGGAAFHSARWDQTVTVDGARVGVIGNGSTGVQIITALSKRSERVLQFQRTPQWVAPWPNRTYTRLSKLLLRRSPRLSRLLYQTTQRVFDKSAEAMLAPNWQRRFLQAQVRLYLRTVRDPQLRARLTPDYEPMCKRLIVSAGYYRAVQRPTVDVVTDAIDHVERRGIVTADGRLHELDVIVYATGFDAHAFMRPMRLTGENGLELSEAWKDGPRAHRTVALPGFPNLFLMMGPNSPINNTSLVPIAETQASFILQWIDRIRDGSVSTVQPTVQATDAFNALIRENMGGTTWASGCNSWFLGPDGTPTLWPFPMERYRAMLATPDDREFVIRPGTSHPAGALSASA